MKFFLWLIIFISLFSFKLFGFLDLSLLVISLVAFRLLISRKTDIKIILELKYIIYLFFILIAYTGIITIINGGLEYIWFLKMIKSLLLIILIYILQVYYSFKSINYNKILLFIIISVILHSVIIYLNISNVFFREFIYSITGYQPRGPEWSRSPGLTISFNSTAIVHITAIYILLFSFAEKIFLRLICILIIIPSLFFLGRFIAYIGLALILILLISRAFYKKNLKLIFISIVFTYLLYFIFTLNISDLDLNNKVDQILFNVSHFIDPIKKIGTAGGVDSYSEESLSTHWYFSDDWKTILFGNSFSGHIGLMGGAGETDSDLGIVNSINANGIIFTLLLTLFYFSLVFNIALHKKDWKIIAFITFLTLSLSFKETGFLTSSATPLLFIIYFNQILTGKNNESN